MRTRRCIQTSIGYHQPAHGLPTDDVRLYDLIEVFFANPAVPNRFGINHHVRSMLALIEAAGLVRAHPALQPTVAKLRLQCFLQLRLPSWVAAPSRTGRIAHVRADKNV